MINKICCNQGATCQVWLFGPPQKEWKFHQDVLQCGCNVFRFFRTVLHRGWYSSVGKASDWKARCNTDADSSRRCGKGFFSQCRLSCGVCSPAPVCNHMHQHLCARSKSKHWQPYHCLDNENTARTLTGMGSADLAAAVPYSGKVTHIFCKGQGSTKKINIYTENGMKSHQDMW